MAIVLHHSRAKGTVKLIAVGIANHQGDGGSYPGMETLAKYGGVDVRNARKAVRKLEELGEVATIIQGGGDRDTPDEERTNRYEILVTCPPWCDRSPHHRDTRKLRTRQPGLWTNPRTSASPGPRTRTPASPGPRTPASPEPSLEPRDETGSASTTGRARPCADCGKDEFTCQRLQQRWAVEDRHPYAEG